MQDGPNTRFCRRKSLSDGQWKERAPSVFVQVEVFVQSPHCTFLTKKRPGCARELPEAWLGEPRQDGAAMRFSYTSCLIPERTRVA